MDEAAQIPLKETKTSGAGTLQGQPRAKHPFFAYPTAFLRAYLGKMRKEGYGGGAECAFLYSFYMQHMLLPQTRNEEDILLLRTAAVPADRGF